MTKPRTGRQSTHADQPTAAPGERAAQREVGSVRGHHRLGRLGPVYRPATARQQARYRARHRRAGSALRWTADAASVVGALAGVGVVLISTFYTASGVAAVAQMLAR